ncbi:hypothetical protein E2C01_056896 [Portunus trituberculatus]|uniref:Uncharacterized protein n=1 Tax=Portunus trituberculatus TaxID=210409 RepID=A0A5B7GYX0_PORTR|nr:hypothetical protein [Portunus trituberculatus]
MNIATPDSVSVFSISQGSKARQAWKTSERLADETRKVWMEVRGGWERAWVRESVWKSGGTSRAGEVVDGRVGGRSNSLSHGSYTSSREASRPRGDGICRA